MSQNPINNFNCLKCKGTKQESEELEAKGSQYVGLAACDSKLYYLKALYIRKFSTAYTGSTLECR
jgi:predicted nucleic-acid-binding Zn-ribbon protein